MYVIYDCNENSYAIYICFQLKVMLKKNHYTFQFSIELIEILYFTIQFYK